MDLEQIELQQQAIRADVAELACFLQGTLGQRLTAYLAGLNDARQVGRWIREQHRPSTIVAERLRAAYQVVKLIGGAYGADTAQAWLYGSNPVMDDEAPATVLRDAVTPRHLTIVVRAGRAFAAGGY